MSIYFAWSENKSLLRVYRQSIGKPAPSTLFYFNRPPNYKSKNFANKACWSFCYFWCLSYLCSLNLKDLLYFRKMYRFDSEGSRKGLDNRIRSRRLQEGLEKWIHLKLFCFQLLVCLVAIKNELMCYQ